MQPLFFDLRATHNPHRWYLPLTDAVCVGPPGQKFMFGGVGLAAAISAMERTTSRPVIWATAQYLSFARLGSIVDLDVRTPAVGKHTTQARVIGHVEDEEIITVNAALGARPGPDPYQWVQAPTAPRPEDCEAVDERRFVPGSLRTRFEVRHVAGRYQSGEVQGRGAGRLSFWIRPVEDHPIGSDILAIVADYVSVGISDAIGEGAGGNSLDNTIRFARMVPTDWILAEVVIESLQSGIVHGVMRLFSRDGVLMASAGQSLILRRWAERE